MTITAGNTSIITVDIQKDIIDTRASMSFGALPLVNISRLDSAKNVLIPVNNENLSSTKAEFLAELESPTAKDTVLNSATLTPKRLATSIEVSEEIMGNSSIDLKAYIKERMIERIMYTIDRGLVIDGTATGTEAKSIQKYVHTANGSTTTAYGAALSYEDILSNYALFKGNPSFMKDAFLVISPDCKLSVLDSKFNEKLSFANVPKGAEATFLGMPVYYTNVGASYTASDTVTAKTTAYVIGNTNAYTVGMTDIVIKQIKGDTQSELKNMSTFQAVTWVDGKLTNKNARQAFRVI